jgi:hypothetical protein
MLEPDFRVAYMVSCCAVPHELLTETKTPDAAPLVPHVALEEEKVTESARVTVTVSVSLAVPETFS